MTNGGKDQDREPRSLKGIAEQGVNGHIARGMCRTVLDRAALLLKGALLTAAAVNAPVPVQDHPPLLSLRREPGRCSPWRLCRHTDLGEIQEKAFDRHHPEKFCDFFASRYKK
jgi:hypothetical protein